jgi:hypothetical protein
MHVEPRWITVVVVLCWVVGFVLSRVIMLVEAWYHEVEVQKEDIFVLANLCNNHFIKSSMGETYSDVCGRARLALSLSPIAKAVRRVVSNTYLCGDVSCMSLLERGFATVGTLAMGVCAVVAVGAVALGRVVSTMYSSRGRAAYDIESMGYHSVEQRLTGVFTEKPKQL